MSNPDIQAQLDLLEANMAHEIVCGGDAEQAGLRCLAKQTAVLMEAALKGYDVSEWVDV